MCFTAVKEFANPIKVMLGWKILEYSNGKYATPYRYTNIKKNQARLLARGKKIVDRTGSCNLYHGGFIHCYRTRSIARQCKDTEHQRIVKVKCYNVVAFGQYGDLVCSKIEFLWNEKS